MALVAPDVGEQVMLARILNKSSADDVKLHLYVNNVTPDEDTLLGDLTEASDPSYAAISLTGANWTIATVANVTTGSYASQRFTFTGGATVYGYYFTDASETNLLWVERFTDGPYNILSNGGFIDVVPKATFD